MEIDLGGSIPKKKTRRIKEPKGKKTPLKILIVTLAVCCVISLLSPSEDEQLVDEEIVNIHDEVVGDSAIATRINGCSLTYDPNKWEQTETGLSAICDTGYYTLSFYKDTLGGISLEDLQESTLNVYEDMQGIEIGGEANYETDTYKRAEVAYGRIEVNVNNIVTGNGENTREIYIQPKGTDIYFGIIIKSYVTDGADYAEFENDVENIIESLGE